MPVHAILQVGHKGETGIGPQIRVNQFNRNRAQLIRRPLIRAGQTTARVASDLGDHKGERVTTVTFFVFLAQGLSRPLHFAHHGQRILAGRIRRHQEVARDRSPFRGVKETPLHVARHENADLSGQKRDRPRQHRIARPNDKGHNATEYRIAEPAEAVVHDTAWPIVPMLFCTMHKRVAHVVGQDQETLNKRGDQHHDHSKWDIDNQIPETPADGRQAKEGDDSGQRGGKDRHEHATCRIFGGDGGGFAQPPCARVGVFSDHDGVIHHNAERDDQPE